MIAIIDYDAGNLKSVEKALEYIGEKPVITRDKNEILSAGRVILPGVGAFGDAMGNLRRYDLVDTLRIVVDKGTPLLGICMGMQALFDRSDETDGVDGLSILSGEIKAIPHDGIHKIPHFIYVLLNFQKNQSCFQEFLRGHMFILCIRIILKLQMQVMWQQQQNMYAILMRL